MASLEQIRYLNEDKAHYRKCFKVYCDNSVGYPIRLDGLTRQWFDTITTGLAANRKSNQPLHMLGVGSGAGETELEMMQALASYFGKIHNTVVEPSPDQLAKYRLRLSQTAGMDNVEVDFREMTIEQHRRQEAARDHSKQNPEDILEYLYSCLKEGGILLVVLVAGDGGAANLWNRYPDLQDSRNRQISSKSIRDTFKKLSIDSRTYRGKCRVDLTECYRDAYRPSEKSDLLLDFISHIIKFRETVGDEFYHEYLDCVASETVSERLHDNRVLFMNDWEAVIAQKPAN
ncbi:histamine N-methyltransferase-like [Diadema antillarum]|uniref:histamine N-methyltransferase-like n=1 Tax=Diadema antillarum TaxID=105358 RepID=UPI003A83B02E